MVINRRWLPLNALRAFEAAARHRSFTRGAEALNVSQSALSRHVIGLEEMLGQPLFVRKSQGLELTEAGQALLPALTKGFDRIEAVLNSVRDGDGAGRTLRLHVPPSLLQQTALPMLRALRTEFSEVTIDVASSNGVGLPDADLDLAIVFDKPEIDAAISDLLWKVRVTPVCAPDLAGQAKGRNLTAFLAANDLLHVRLEGEPRALLWANFARQCGIDLDVSRGLGFDTAVAAVTYAMTGGGVALADVNLFDREIREGRLVAPFAHIFEDGYGYYLKLHAEDLEDPLLAAMRNWIISWFSQAQGIEL